MKLKLKQPPEAGWPILSHKKKLDLLRDFIGREMQAMIREAAVNDAPVPTSDSVLASLIVDRIDSDGRAPNRLRIAAELQIEYHLRRSTWRLERGIPDWLR